MNLYLRLNKLNVNNFKEKVKNRYYSLRDNILSTENLINRYDYYYQLITTCGAAEREGQKWSEDTDVDGRIIDFDSEFNDIKTWITKHMEFLDNNIFPKNTNITTFKAKKTDLSPSIYNLQGNKISLPYQGVYIMNGKKYKTSNNVHKTQNMD